MHDVQVCVQPAGEVGRDLEELRNSRDWLPGEHLVWLLIEVVNQLDLHDFRRAYRTDGHGRAAYDPATLLVVDDGGYSFPCADVSTTPLTFEFTMDCTTTIKSRWTESMHGWQTIFAGPDYSSDPAVQKAAVDLDSGWREFLERRRRPRCRGGHRGHRHGTEAHRRQHAGGGEPHRALNRAGEVPAGEQPSGRVAVLRRRHAPRS